MPAAILSAIGFADDVLGHIPSTWRLLGQAATGMLAAKHGGRNPAIGSFVTTTVVNVVNFMDGINGITCTTLAVWGHQIAASDDLPKVTRWIGTVAFGSALGFLPWNSPKATIFLGDSGSYFYGGLVSSALLQCTTQRQTLKAASPLIPYFLDTTQALAYKLLKGESLTSPHRYHGYQRLVDRGVPQTLVAASYAAASLALSHIINRLLRQGISK